MRKYTYGQGVQNKGRYNGFEALRWGNLLRPLSKEKIIDGSYHRYMRELICFDLEKKLETLDEFDQIMTLEVMVHLLQRENNKRKEDKIREYRCKLALLLRKHRREIIKQRREIIERWSF